MIRLLKTGLLLLSTFSFFFFVLWWIHRYGLVVMHSGYVKPPQGQFESDVEMGFHVLSSHIAEPKRMSKMKNNRHLS